MARTFLFVGALSGFLGVVLGAFGAHALQRQLDEAALRTFETGVRYQLFHALALLAVGLLARQSATPLLEWSGWLFVAGSLVFSGTLYLLAVTGVSWLGAITPLGGVAFLGGWVLLAVSALRWSG